MDNIPVELFEGICNVVDDRAALKALRLVNNQVANIVTRYLFKTLIVYQHMSSWRKVELIAHCPRLASLVKKLELVPLIVSPNTLSYYDWKQRSQGHRVEDYLRLGDRGAAVAERVEPLDDSLATVLKLQQRYQISFWCPEAIQRSAASFKSHLLLESLPLRALSEIEMAWPPDLLILGPYSSRREREGNSRLGIIDLFGPLNKRCNAHLSFALLVLHDSGLKITTLELHQYREVLLNQMYQVPTVVYLKHLKLNFRHPFDVEHKQARAMADGANKFGWTLAPYLANAENLETLILTQDRFTDRREDRCVYSFDIVPILSTAPWPKLRSVWFGEVFTRSPYLLQFTRIHGNSLRSLHLDQPVGCEAIWRLLAFALHRRCASSDCVISSRDNSLFHSESACVKDSYYFHSIPACLSPSKSACVFHSKSAYVRKSDLPNNEYDWPGSTQH